MPSPRWERALLFFNLIVELLSNDRSSSRESSCPSRLASHVG
jgi:hypothetical protein